MPSPFPGMDPYLEAQNRWPDFHHEFISQCRAAINARLPDDYVATINERVQTIELAEQEPRVILPDVSVVRSAESPEPPGGEPPGGSPGGAAVAVLEPLTLPQSVQWLDKPTEAYIEIFHLPDYRLVTGVKVFSRSNKVNPGRVAYLAKRRDLLHHGVNLVEIDLLLAGERLEMLAPLPPGDYYAFVTRWGSHDRCGVYAWSIRRPLPTIRIPLRPPDADVPLDLAAVLRSTYELGRYSRLLRYGQPVGLPLSAADAAWAEAQGAVSRP